jgi:hypothetical protein
MKQVPIFIISMLIITSCNNSKDQKKEEAVTDSPVTQTGSDSAAIRNVIIDFYSWYTTNYNKLMNFELYSSIKKNNAAPYQMNWDEVKRYQDFIRDSVPHLGDEFLVEQKRMFEKADSAFKVDLDSDVPAYFDYDWYTNSQEAPSYLRDGLKASTKWNIAVKGERATVEIGAPDDKNYLSGSLLLFVALKKENGQWTISGIGND